MAMALANALRAGRGPPYHGLAFASRRRSSTALLREQVLRGDTEGYLCASLMPSSGRESALTMRALNCELVAARDAARGNVAMGRLRLGFWRDLVAKAFLTGAAADAAPPAASSATDPPQRHPLFAPLRDSVRRHRHTRRWLERLIDARDADLGANRDYAAVVSSEAFAAETLADSELFAEQTCSPLLYLALEAVGVRDVHADHAASHIGKAAGLCALLRAMPVHCRAGQVFLPGGLLAKHGLKAADLVAQPDEVRLGSDGSTLLQQAEINGMLPTSARDLSGGGSGRGLAMTLARSGAGFGTGLDLQVQQLEQQQQLNILDGGRGAARAAPAATAPQRRPASSGEGAGGVWLAMSPAAVRLAAAEKAGSASAAISTALPPPKEASAAWSAALAVLRSGAAAVHLSLHKPPAVQAALRNAVCDVACQARAHVEHARAMLPRVPAAARAALLPAVPADRFLRRLEAQDFDVFAAGGLGPWRDGRSYSRLLLHGELLRHTLSNTY